MSGVRASDGPPRKKRLQIAIASFVYVPHRARTSGLSGVRASERETLLLILIRKARERRRFVALRQMLRWTVGENYALYPEFARASKVDKVRFFLLGSLRVKLCRFATNAPMDSRRELRALIFCKKFNLKQKFCTLCFAIREIIVCFYHVQTF